MLIYVYLILLLKSPTYPKTVLGYVLYIFKLMENLDDCRKKCTKSPGKEGTFGDCLVQQNSQLEQAAQDPHPIEF